MAAYVISEVEVRDHDAMTSYRQLASQSIEQYGGRYLVRGAAADVAEGAESKASIVIVEFPSMARLHEWYVSPEYAKALAFRPAALERRLIFADGVVQG